MFKLLAAICLLAVAGSVYGQASTQVNCANLLAWSSGPVDGSYKPYTWQCNQYSAMDVNMFLLEKTGTAGNYQAGLTCGCTGGSACLSTHQCASQGCLSDNGGCSTNCGYTSTGAVQCSCATGTSLVDSYRCNCESFREYPQSGWVTATNYLCADNSSATTTGIIIIPGTSTSTSTTGSASGNTPASTTASQGPPASTSTTAQSSTPPPASSTTGVQSGTPSSTTGVNFVPVNPNQVTSDTHAIFRLQGSVAMFVRSRFTSGLASFLGIAEARIIINSLRSGSVIVDTSIAEGPQGTPSATASLNKIFQTGPTTLSNAVGYNVIGLNATNNAAAPAPTDAIQTQPNRDDGLSGGAIAGIVIGSVIFVALVAVIVFLLVRIRNNNKRSKYANRKDVDLPVSSSTAQLNPSNTAQKW